MRCLTLCVQVVFMGQGEPLYNWRNVSAAVDVMTDRLMGRIAPVREFMCCEPGCGVTLPIAALCKETVDREHLRCLAEDGRRGQVCGVVARKHRAPPNAVRARVCVLSPCLSICLSALLLHRTTMAAAVSSVLTWRCPCML